MRKKIIKIPLFHTRLLDLAPNWVMGFDILNLLFNERVFSVVFNEFPYINSTI